MKLNPQKQKECLRPELPDLNTYHQKTSFISASLTNANNQQTRKHLRALQDLSFSSISKQFNFTFRRKNTRTNKHCGSERKKIKVTPDGIFFTYNDKVHSFIIMPFSVESYSKKNTLKVGTLGDWRLLTFNSVQDSQAKILWAPWGNNEFPISHVVCRTISKLLFNCIPSFLSTSNSLCFGYN